MQLSDYTNHNRRAWDEIADIRHQKFPEADFFTQGGSLLSERTVAAAGPVNGRRLLHLQCATGEDTLSWSVLGAEATGVDISPQQIALAQQKAAAAGLSTRFLAADIYALPDALQCQSFDLLFTGGGALVWLPDIWRWGQVVAQALEPGGKLILDEGHPIAGCLSVEGDQIIIEDDYFDSRPQKSQGGWRHFAGGEDAQEANYQVTWPLGHIVTSLAQAGLIIERLEEYPNTPKWRFGDQQAAARRLPGAFLLVARRG